MAGSKRLLFQGVKRNINTSQIVSVSENESESFMVRYGLGAELADALSQFDAVIFVHDDNVIEAIQAGEDFPLHGPLTHECIHIIESRTDQHLITRHGLDVVKHGLTGRCLALTSETLRGSLSKAIHNRHVKHKLDEILPPIPGCPLHLEAEQWSHKLRYGTPEPQKEDIQTTLTQTGS